MPAFAPQLATLRRFLPSRFTDVVRGMAFGLGFVVLHRSWAATFGTIPSAEMVMLWLGCLGCAAAARLDSRARALSPGHWLLLIGAFAASAPWLIGPASGLLALLPLGALTLHSAQVVAMIPAGLLVWCLPACLVGCYWKSHPRGSGRGAQTLICGFACGLLLAANLVGPWWGPQTMAWIVAGLLAFDAIRQLTTGTQAVLPDETSADAATSMATPPASSAGFRGQLLQVGAGAALLAAALNATGQWTLSSAWRTYTIIAAFLLGVVAGGAMDDRRRRWSVGIPAGMSVFVACLLALSMFFAGESWIAGILSVNVNISQSGTILLVRALMLGLVPCGFGWAASRMRGTESTTGGRRLSLAFVAVGVWTLTDAVLRRGLSPAWIAASAGGILAAALLMVWWRASGDSLVRRAAAVSACGVLMAAGGMSLGYPALTPSRFLFNGNVAQFVQRGADWSRLHGLDAKRPSGLHVGETGVFSAWNNFGLQTVLKRDGVPIGYVSHDYRLMPQAPTDVLLAALPLTIHEGPLSACFLGWGAGVPISTALEFPIERVVCVETEALLPELTFPSDGGEPHRGIDPRHDDRAAFLPIPPALAVRGKLPRFDVVISNPPLSALAEAGPEYTREFYAAAARHVNPGGLFCQRLQHADQGLQGVLDVLATMQSVFPEVVSINFMPGETLLVGFSDRDRESLKELPERLQAPHVARVLSRCGWDWGNMAQIPMLSSSAIEELLRTRSVSANRTGDDRIAFSHPLELVRWGNKWEEKQQALMSLQTRLVDLAGDEAQTDEVKRRISETKLQQYVMSEVPDRPWAYRANLKKELQTKPRTQLVQVKGERPRQELHPVDQHRYEYLKALAGAYRSFPPRPEKIHQLTEFVAPYDPLLTYFIHFEAAELYSRNPELDPRAEYLHRLHTVYFGDARDRSIRNVTACLELLSANPTLAGSPSDRFDQFNGLLQILYQRWQARRGLAPDSVNVALNDITESISVAERAVAEMDALAADAVPGAEHWSARKQFIDSELIRPLRSYRGQMLPEQAKLMQRMKSASEGQGDSTVESTAESADFELDEATDSDL